MLKRKLILRFCLIGFLSILVTSIISFVIFNNFFRNQVKADLTKTGEILAQSYQSSKTEHYFNDLLQTADHSLRITLIAPTGKVLLDSRSDVSLMDDHQTRQEVQDALVLGQGSASRHSETLHKASYYFAIKLHDGNILRISKEIHGFLTVYAGVLPALAVTCIFMLLLCILLSIWFVRQTVKPIDAALEHLDAPGYEPVYDEFSPFLHEIKRQRIQINDKISMLEQEKEKLQMITGHMSEGLLLLNHDKTVLLANLSVLKLLGAESSNAAGQNILTITRNLQILDCINQALQGRQLNETVFENGCFLQVTVDIIEQNHIVTGVLLLLHDITDTFEAETARKEFTANVSHELKTPLTIISGYAELISGDECPSDDIRNFSGKIQKEAGRMLLLINDIIKLSELDQPKKEAGHFPVDLCQIIHSCMQSLDFPARQRKITYTINASPCTVTADPGLMETLIYNLCDNAIRYNKENGKIEIRLINEGDNIILKISDTGIGIAPQDQNHVFERFYRVDKSRSKLTGGTGLGLSIVKHIVSLHHGKIDLKSQKDIGTTVTITLPRHNEAGS